MKQGPILTMLACVLCALLTSNAATAIRVTAQIRDPTTDIPIPGASCALSLPVSSAVIATGSDATFSGTVVLNVARTMADVVLRCTSEGYEPTSSNIYLNSTDITLDFLMSPALPNDMLRLVLRWGVSPSDLDLHLSLPSLWPCSKVYYSSKTCSISNPPSYAFLDQDITSGNGRELVSLSFPPAGTYVLNVHQFSGGGRLPTSNGTLYVYSSAGKVFSISVPASSESLYVWVPVVLFVNQTSSLCYDVYMHAPNAYTNTIFTSWDWPGQENVTKLHSYCRSAGCTNPDAINYNPSAAADDGSCKYKYRGYVVDDVASSVAAVQVPTCYSGWMTRSFSLPQSTMQSLIAKGLTVGLSFRGTEARARIVSPNGAIVDLFDSYSSAEPTSCSVFNARFSDLAVHNSTDACSTRNSGTCSTSSLYFSAQIKPLESLDAIAPSNEPYKSGTWRLELCGASAVYERSQLVFEDYVLLKPTTKLIQTNSILICPQYDVQSASVTLDSLAAQAVNPGDVMLAFACEGGVLGNVTSKTSGASGTVVEFNEIGLESAVASFGVRTAGAGARKRGASGLSWTYNTERIEVSTSGAGLTATAYGQGRLSFIVDRLDVNLDQDDARLDADVRLVTEIQLGASVTGSQSGSDVLYFRGAPLFRTIATIREAFPPLRYEVSVQLVARGEISGKISASRTLVSTSRATLRSTWKSKSIITDFSTDPVRVVASADDPDTCEDLATMSVFVYPYLAAEVTPGVGGSNEVCCCGEFNGHVSTYAGIGGGFRVKLRLLGADIVNLEKFLFDRVFPLSAQCFKAPLICPSSPCDSNVVSSPVPTCPQRPEPKKPGTLNRPAIPARQPASRVLGLTQGDPHFRTWDGCRYMFHGRGEYVLAQVDGGSELLITARLSPFGASEATSLKEWALRTRDNDTILFTFDRDANPIVWLNGSPISRISRTCPLQISDTTSISIDTRDRFSVKIGYGHEQAEITAGRMLSGATAMWDIVPSLPATYWGRVTGLYGTADGVRENDVSLRDGTVIGCSASSENISHAFWDEWRVPSSESLFKTRNGTEKPYYGWGGAQQNLKRSLQETNPPFTPIFASPAEEASATKACRASQTTFFEECMFDMAALGNASVLVEAVTSAYSAAISNYRTVQATSKQAPIMVSRFGNRKLNMGETLTFQVQATDEGDSLPTYRIHPNVPGASIDAASGLFTFTPQSAGTFKITLYARDAGGLESSDVASVQVEGGVAVSASSTTGAQMLIVALAAIVTSALLSFVA